MCVSVRRGVSVAVASLASAGACRGIVIRHDRDDALYQALGNMPQFDTVNKLIVTDSGAACGATLIAPEWVITAAHCVAGVPLPILAYIVDGTPHAAAEVVIHPDWNGNPTLGGDVALVRLETAVAGLGPAVRFRETTELGRVGVAVGFGVGGTGLTGGTGPAGTKRGMENVIDVFGTALSPPINVRVMLADFDSPINPGVNRWGSAAPLDLEGMIASGDSGGGVFFEVGGEWQYAGVISFVGAFDGNANGNYGDVMGAMRVSAFNGWIDGIVPGPGGLVVFVVGVGLVWRRRR